MNLIKIFLVLFTLAGIHESYAGDTLSDKYPNAILVQLRSEQSRIIAFTNKQRYKEAEEVKEDAAAVRSKMIADFTDNFHFCPVYYYMDTNENFIKDKAFAGMLMNNKGDFVSSQEASGITTDYVIVYYGYAISQSKLTRVVKDSSLYTYDPDPPSGKRLVILNDKFQQISYCKKSTCDDFPENDNEINKYVYVSKHYDIEYCPSAKSLDKKLNKKYRRKKRNKYKIKVR